MNRSQEQAGLNAVGDIITVVSGLPRSGTSMLMRVLLEGGMPILADDSRAEDEHNPHGYFEFAAVKRLKQGADWLPRARGRAVKVVSYLLPLLPMGENYRVLFLERALEEVLASQDRMLGKAFACANDQLLASLALQNEHARAWIARLNAPCLTVSFAAMHADPRVEVARIAEFLGGGVDVDRMAAAVDLRLYRTGND